MPIKTQMRLTQITGSLGTGAGQINDNQPKEAKAAIAADDLSSVLSHLAAGIQRIHGDADFSDSFAGQFQHSRMSVTGSEMALLNTYEIATEGANTTLSLGGKAGLNLKEDGTTILAIADNRNVNIQNARAVDIQASNTVSIDSTGGPIAIGSDPNNENIVIGTNGDRTITIGRDSGNTTLNLRGEAADIQLDAGTNSVVVTADGFDVTGQPFQIEVVDNNSAAWSIDATGGQPDLIKVDTQTDRVHIHELVVDTDSTLDNLTVNGNLTVLGTQTTLDVNNLSVEDKFILLGDGNQSLNDASGIIFASGSDVAGRPDAAFGKLHGDTTGAFVFGSVASNSASITDLSGLQADLPLRAGVFQVGSANDLIDMNGSQLRLKSGAGHEFDLGGANDLIDFGHGGTGKGQIAFDSDKFVMSASLDNLVLASANNGVVVQDTYDGGASAMRTLFTARYSAMTQGSEILFDSSRAAAVNASGGQPLQLGHFSSGYLEMGTLDGGAKMGFAPLQLSGSYDAASTGAYTATLVVGGAQGSFGSDVIGASKANLIISGSAMRLDHGVSGSAALEFKSDTANVVSLKAPTSLASNVSLVLPPDDGNNGDVLITDGNGVLTFAPAGGAANSRKYTGTLDKGLAANTALSFDATGGGATDVIAETAFDLDLRNVGAADRLNNIDVYVNGQLMMSGTSAPQVDVTGGDYVVIDVATGVAGFNASEDKADLKFAFALEADDVVSVIMRA